MNVLAVYRFTESFPEREKYGLAHQMRRAAVSIPANIAEGFGKHSQPEKAGLLNIVLTDILEEASRLLNAYARAILASGS
jgi:four helix bundle protein